MVGCPSRAGCPRRDGMSHAVDQDILGFTPGFSMKLNSGLISQFGGQPPKM